MSYFKLVGIPLIAIFLAWSPESHASILDKKKTSYPQPDSPKSKALKKKKAQNVVTPPPPRPPAPVVQPPTLNKKIDINPLNDREQEKAAKEKKEDKSNSKE